MVRVQKDEGMRFIDNACSAHAMVDDYSVDGDKLKVKFSLLAATDPAQVGKAMNEFFPLEGKGTGKVWDLIEACRIVPHGADRKGDLDFDESRLKGCQCCLKITLEPEQEKNPATGKYEDKPGGKMYPRIGFQCICDTNDAKAASVPKDPQFLAMWNQGRGAMGGGQAAPHQAQQQSPPAQTQQAAAAPQSLGNW